MASCTMPIKDVGELVNALENAGELKRISAQVDPDLEIAEILRRTMYAKGPAILFENVKGTLPKTMCICTKTCTCTNKTQRHYAKRFHTRIF